MSTSQRRRAQFRKPALQDTRAKTGPGNLANWRRLHGLYLERARAAVLAGDPIDAENFYQHAEHYFRMIAGTGA